MSKVSNRSTPRGTRGKPERWIVLPDTHLPYEDKATLRAVEAYMGDHQWAGWIHLGDLIDFNELSRFEVGNNRLDKVGAIQKSYDATRSFLDRHRSIIGRKARMVYIEGNHEDRITQYLEKNPEGVGMLEVPQALNLKARNIQWVPFWSRGDLFRLGNAYFCHGRATGTNHTRKMLDKYGVCLYYGHLHDIQLTSKATWGNNKTLEAGSLGCLCRYDQTYLKGNPTNWQQAFGVFHVWPDGYYQHYTVRIFKSRFISPEGKEYRG